MHRLLATSVLALLLTLAGCSGQSAGPPLPNHIQPLNSPSGKYVLTVPIETTRNPKDPGRPVWKVTIADPAGQILYRDDDSLFRGDRNSYWTWDSSDRAWLYYSDSGNVFFWEPQDGNWQKAEWGHAHKRSIARDITPPDGLYPEYLK